ncbi:MAG: flagellar basal body rod protein FlgB [Hyphomicrobiales bacterium]|nr:flagellar basal body rod protein FlgB [Hyphomicrobiales bacterium]MCP5373596.1 flagellar basal body rod protein FlgB [Hyphomicrobiales bacterium]
MDLNKLTLFGMVKKRLAWLAQRQEVVAQNIANADSPGYRPKDLRAFQFRELVRREGAELNMAVSQPGHQGGRRKRIRDFAEETERRPFETAPAGNAVILEEQMGKLNETGAAHKLTSELYKKHLNMIRIAIGKG